MSETGTTTALQAALAGEHAAVYGFGVVGAYLRGDPEAADVSAALVGHELRRDHLRVLVLGTGSDPVPAAAAYRLPFRVTSAADARRLATHLEEGVAEQYAALVAAGEGDLRRQAAQWLAEAAVRAGRWRGTSIAFPGLPGGAAGS
jgi:hypothetical protein